MRRSFALVALVLVLAVAVLALGCGSTTTTAGQATTTAGGAATTVTAGATTSTAAAAKVAGVDPVKKTINVAVLGPMSGTTAEYGKSQQRATTVFNKLEMPSGMKSGPYAGYTFSYQFFDGKGDPTEAANIAQQIVMGDFFVTVGSSLSLESLAAAPILDRKNIVMYTTFAASGKLTSSGWKNVFMSFPTATIEGAAGADVVVTKLGYKKVVDFYENSPYGQELHAGFEARAKELGATVLSSYTHEAKSDVSFSSPLTEIKGQQPDCIYLAEFYEGAGLIVSQSLKLGLNVPFVACSGALDNSMIDLAGGADAVKNVTWTSLYSPESAKPKVQAFVKEYQAQYNLTPDDASSLTYDALLDIMTAIEAGAAKREDLAAKLHDPSLPKPEGITNPAISHDANGNIQGSELLLINYKDGKFALAQ
jgi:branched-chain amino acid transport system substrate-binding protein